MDLTPSASPASLNQPESSSTSPKLTPEQEEEIKLRSKYPNPQKPGGSSFIQKMLHKGNKKYFDSGDYNMARSRNKALLNKTSQIQTQVSTESSNVTSSLNDSPSSLNQDNSCLNPPVTPSLDLSNNNPVIITNSTPLNNIINNQTVNSPTIANNSNSNLTPSNNQMSNSVSTSSLLNIPNNQANQMSQSISTDKISNIHLNTSLNNVLIDSEEIGHGIPTPECLQSRKHSIAQSKLATPRLSTS